MAYEPLDTSKNEIRLLEVFPQLPSGLIPCKTYHVSLGEAPWFTAISYTWGDPLATEKILLNGQVREVTANCWHVLGLHSQISESHANRPIWIDAICINQHDVGEREQQVLRMHLIYAKGFCEVHLGYFVRDPFSQWDDRVAVKALQTLAKRFKPNEQRSSDQDQNVDRGAIGLSEEEDKYVEESLGHICQFLDKPWFSRMWIVQEFVMGSKSGAPCFLGNGGVISTPDLTFSCLELSGRTIHLPTPQRRALLTGISRYLNLVKALKLYQERPMWCIMPQLLGMFRDQLASDPRDKIYSILGLLQTSDVESTEAAVQTTRPQEFDRQSLHVDYAAPIEEVYVRVVKAIILATGQLDIICACQEQTGFTRTWTPDWRQPGSRTRLNSLSNFWPGEEVLCHASASVGGEATFSDDLRVLYARGIHHSTIVRTSMKWSSRSIHDVPDLKKEYFSLTDSELPIAILNRENGNGDDGGSDEGDNGSDKDDKGDDPGLRLALAMGGGTCFTTDEVGFEDPFLFVPGRSAAWCEKSWESNTLTSQFIRIGEGRRTMRTSSESLGIGPEELEVGDVICVLLGCSIPVVLRMVNDYYTFIGECYIHEIMQGELVRALEKGEVGSQLFNIR